MITLPYERLALTSGEGGSSHMHSFIRTKLGCELDGSSAGSEQTQTYFFLRRLLVAQVNPHIQQATGGLVPSQHVRGASYPGVLLSRGGKPQIPLFPSDIETRCNVYMSDT